MMKKEEAAYTKFCQIGSAAEEHKKSVEKRSKRKALENKEPVEMTKEEEEYYSNIQGMLLLLLEDDSKMVRIAGINCMSHFAK